MKKVGTLRLMNAGKKVALAFCFVLLFVVLFVVFSEGIIHVDTAIAHKNIKKYGLATEEGYLYVSKEEIDKTEKVQNVISKLPHHISQEIQNHWIILISETDPYSENETSALAGEAHTRAKVIWLSPDFTEKILVHEIGHAIASIHNLDLSKEFRLFHNSTVNMYASFEKGSAHELGTPYEFFALLFENYFCESDWLKTNFEEGYEYMETQIIESPTSTDSTGLSLLAKNYNLLSYEIEKLWACGASLFNLAKVEKDVSQNSLINVSDYEVTTSYSGLDSYEKEMLGQIFDVIDHPENYPVDTYKKQPVIVLKYDHQISFAAYNHLAACVDYYFGKECTDVFDVVSSTNNEQATIYIHTDVLEQLKQEREIYIAKVDEVLGTLHEGTETQKLLQICKFIRDNCGYKEKETTSVADFWNAGEGDCVTYAMVFRQFCERLGIECDIVFGMSQFGEGHVWNRVLLSDGSYRYYDLTYYNLGKIDMLYYDDFVFLGLNTYSCW